MALSQLTKKHLALVIVAACFFVSDRILKTLALAGFKAMLVPNLFNFHLSFNSRLALSLGPNNNPFVLIMIIAIILIILVVLIWSFVKKLPDLSVALTFILLGAISNVLDRLLFGQVIDYFDVPLTIFNLADLLIIAGTIILISTFNFNKHKKST